MNRCAICGSRTCDVAVVCRAGCVPAARKARSMDVGWIVAFWLLGGFGLGVNAWIALTVGPDAQGIALSTALIIGGVVETWLWPWSRRARASTEGTGGGA